jgi:acyl-CoA hydrolase
MPSPILRKIGDDQARRESAGLLNGFRADPQHSRSIAEGFVGSYLAAFLDELSSEKRAGPPIAGHDQDAAHIGHSKESTLRPPTQLQAGGHSNTITFRVKQAKPLFNLGRKTLPRGEMLTLQRSLAPKRVSSLKITGVEEPLERSMKAAETIEASEGTESPGRARTGKPRLKGRTPAESRAEMVQVVLPNDANPLGNILGGAVMHLIDITGAIAAHRHARSYVVTASVDSVDFSCPIRVGQVIHLQAEVTRAFHTSMEVEVKVSLEDYIKGERRLTSSAFVTYVAVDEQARPAPVPPLIVRTAAEKRRYREALGRRRRRLIMAARARRRSREEDCRPQPLAGERSK